MSEYQYYEFQAIERPLTDAEQREVRSYSSRAHITPATFVNHYEWGNFKGDVNEWMDKYYDAFLYFANWGAHELVLRLPSGLLDPEAVAKYCHSDCASVRQHNGNVILSLCSGDDYDDLGWEDENDVWRLSSLLPVRSELANGDLRPLYLAWLLSVDQGAVDEDEPEPAVPPGLRELSAAQSSLADFLQIDGDLLDVAAEASPPLISLKLKHQDARRWIMQLAATEKDDLLAELLVGDDPMTLMELRRRFLKEHSTPAPETTAVLRTAGELLRASETRAAEREHRELEEREAERQCRQREAAEAREKYLASLAHREPELWSEIDSLVALKQPSKYDTAVKLVIDLRDLDARTKAGRFQSRLIALQEAHAKKPSFLARLKAAGVY